MKKRSMNKRLSINKQTVSDLTVSEQGRVLGGLANKCENMECKSGSVYYQSSSLYLIGTKLIPMPPKTVDYAGDILPACIL